MTATGSPLTITRIPGNQGTYRKESAMDNGETIKWRIIDRAVDLFARDDPNRGGLFTTAHYGQALKTEFRMPGPVLDAAVCTGHLDAMDGVERAGGCMWRRTAQRDAPVGSDITETLGDADPDAPLDELARTETAVLRALDEPAGMWWTVGTMSAKLKAGALSDLDDDFLESLVGCVLYTLSLNGKAVAKSNVVLEGERGTVFAIADDPSRFERRRSRVRDDSDIT